jgi:hypothetical protein
VIERRCGVLAITLGTPSQTSARHCYVIATKTPPRLLSIAPGGSDGKLISQPLVESADPRTDVCRTVGGTR